MSPGANLEKKKSLPAVCNHHAYAHGGCDKERDRLIASFTGPWVSQWLSVCLPDLCEANLGRDGLVSGWKGDGKWVFLEFFFLRTFWGGKVGEDRDEIVASGGLDFAKNKTSWLAGWLVDPFFPGGGWVMMAYVAGGGKGSGDVSYDEEEWKE